MGFQGTWARTLIRPVGTYGNFVPVLPIIEVEDHGVVKAIPVPGLEGKCRKVLKSKISYSKISGIYETVYPVQAIPVPGLEGKENNW